MANTLPNSSITTKKALNERRNLPISSSSMIGRTSSVQINSQDLDIELPVTISDDGEQVTAKASDVSKVLGEMTRKAQSSTGAFSSSGKARTAPIIIQPVISGSKVVGSSSKDSVPQSGTRLRGGHAGETIKTVKRTRSYNPLPANLVSDESPQHAGNNCQELVPFGSRAHHRNVENQSIQWPQLQAPMPYPMLYARQQPMFLPVWPPMVQGARQSLSDRIFNAAEDVYDDLFHPEYQCSCGLRHFRPHMGCMHCPLIHPWT